MKQADIRIGSLCTGYGGLDMAVMEVFGGKLRWCADNDRQVSMILAVRYPGVLNLGDITALDWPEVERVDIIAAGFPCQDISYNGRGAGIKKGVRSGIWKNIVEGIRALQPKIVVVENVSALRRRGLDQVLGDLAEHGYDAVWTSLRAADIGAAHRRERMFILAYWPEARELLAAAYTHSQRRARRRTPGEAAGTRSPGGPVRPGARFRSAARGKGRTYSAGPVAWGEYADVIERWEARTGRQAPHPTERGSRGQARLSPLFSEWLMGLPAGFVTGLNLPYSATHRALGNGVVPQQAAEALRLLVSVAVGAVSYPDGGWQGHNNA